MKKRETVATCPAPNGATMSLVKHDRDWSIYVDGRELMSTRRHVSEERLAEVACAPLASKPNVSVLIGGLGLGFTLRAALANLGRDARVTVAELMPPVIEWNKNREFGLAADAVEDPRTRIVVTDVYDLIRKSSGVFDVILLDADNNTTAMNTAGNRRLYQRDGLAQVYGALKKGGTVVYWSADSDPLFAKEMGRAGFKVETERVQHTLLIGKRP